MAQKAVQAVVSNVAAFAPGIVVRIGSRGASKYLYMYFAFVFIYQFSIAS